MGDKYEPEDSGSGGSSSEQHGDHHIDHQRRQSPLGGHYPSNSPHMQNYDPNTNIRGISNGSIISNGEHVSQLVGQQGVQYSGSPSSGGTFYLQSPLPSLDNGQVEGGGRKREIRLMKNREAARECRRKKKEYIKCLENRVAVLENQNKALIEELKSLKELYTTGGNKMM